jgi:flagellar protein FlaG
MIDGIGSRKTPTTGPPEGAKAPSRARQGAAPVESPAPAEAPVAKAAAVPGREQLTALAEEMNQTLKQINGNYSVSVDDATGVMVVRITDEDTGEVVKQIPPQQILDVSVSVERIVGLLVNDQA